MKYFQRILWITICVFIYHLLFNCIACWANHKINMYFITRRIWNIPGWSIFISWQHHRQYVIKERCGPSFSQQWGILASKEEFWLFMRVPAPNTLPNIQHWAEPHFKVFRQYCLVWRYSWYWHLSREMPWVKLKCQQYVKNSKYGLSQNIEIEENFVGDFLELFEWNQLLHLVEIDSLKYSDMT